MAIIFVFDSEEERRAEKLGVNYIKVKDESDASLTAMINDPYLEIFMPFLSDENEKKELFTNFHNQIIMRNIWKGDKSEEEKR